MSRADVALLRALRSARPRGISADALAQAVELSRADLERAVEELRVAGFEIERRGESYAFVSAPDRLIADDLRSGGDFKLIGREMIVLERTDSTNDFVQRIVTPALREGVVVFAEKQTAGRGQHGRIWQSASHRGLWFSIYLQPAIDVHDSARLTQWAAQAIATTIAATEKVTCVVRPPNDVFCGGKKVAGVLVEMRVGADGRYFAIVGLGVNLNHQTEDFPPEIRETATSLALTTGRNIERRDFAVALLNELNRSYLVSFAENS